MSCMEPLYFIILLLFFLLLKQVPICFSFFSENDATVVHSGAPEMFWGLWIFPWLLVWEWEDTDWIFIFGVNRSFNKRSIDKNKGKIGKSTRKWAQLNFIFSTNMGNSGPLFSRIHSHFKTKCKWISSVAQESNFPAKDFFFFFFTCLFLSFDKQV